MNQYSRIQHIHYEFTVYDEMNTACNLAISDEGGCILSLLLEWLDENIESNGDTLEGYNVIYPTELITSLLIANSTKISCVDIELEDLE